MFVRFIQAMAKEKDIKGQCKCTIVLVLERKRRCRIVDFDGGSSEVVSVGGWIA